eukprot:CAMPEP_0201576730 /NCGR_PEP_ID=MMETSP0190_2-20130828/22717_1 /ASSEMBLY_ACC=CAM_ASM_000263 /TAXON_ID=37353 /ORGANISM="Rosalina sp." /LENGTH=200 /DNA_ID=CAMNT_0048007953 /DNA_START=1397 /DNA_END=1999 /DNA_ORIENTATION=+
MILRSAPFLQEDIDNVRNAIKKQWEKWEAEEGKKQEDKIKKLEDELELVTVTDGGKQRSITEVNEDEDEDDEEKHLMVNEEFKDDKDNNNNQNMTDNFEIYNTKSMAIQANINEIKSLLNELNQEQEEEEDNEEKQVSLRNMDEKFKLHDEELNVIEENVNEIKLMLLQYLQKKEHNDNNEEYFNVNINDEMDRMKSTEL